MTIQVEAQSPLENPVVDKPIVSDSDSDAVVQCQSGDSLVIKEENDSHCKSRGSEIDTLQTDNSFLSDSEAASHGEVVPSNNNETEVHLEETKGGEEEEWPEAFYCQRTHILMTDPLVGPTGISIDRSAVAQDDRTVYYPNRALQAIVQETVTLRKHPFRAGLKQLQQSMSHGLSQIIPEWNSHETFFRPLNDAFYCPITYNLMHQPVIDPEGNTFERVAVENWIRINHNSPITRTDLRINQLYPNKALEKLLQEEKERPEDQMHPTIRKWKEEPVPRATDVELGGGAVLEHEQRLQIRDGTTTVYVITSTNGGNVTYPTTPSEWTLREENRRRSAYRFFGLFFAAVCLTAFVLYRTIFFLMLFLLTLFIMFSKRPIPPTYN